MRSLLLIATVSSSGSVTLTLLTMYHDEEMPAGFRDADFEMRDLQAQANRESRLRKRGICAHGWTQGPPGPPDKPTSVVTCLYCGQTWQTDAEAYAARREVLL